MLARLQRCLCAIFPLVDTDSADAGAVQADQPLEQYLLGVLAEIATVSVHLTAKLDALKASLTPYISAVQALDMKCSERLGATWRGASDDDLHSATVAGSVDGQYHELVALVKFMQGTVFLWSQTPPADLASVVIMLQSDNDVSKKYTASIKFHAEFYHAYTTSREPCFWPWSREACGLRVLVALSY